MESVVRAAIGGSFTTLAEVLRYNIGVPALWRRYSRNTLKQTSGSRKKTALPAVEGGPMKAEILSNVVDGRGQAAFS